MRPLKEMNDLRKFAGGSTAVLIFTLAILVYPKATPQISNAGQRPVTPTPTATVTPKNPGSPRPTPTPAKDDPDEVIKIDTELVNINVRVIDRNNRPINNIPQKEFRVFEDGVAQQIEFFSMSEVPTNYALMVDNSGSLRQQLEKVIEAGKVFVNANRPADETMLVRFVGRDKITVEEPFTTNKTDLVDALDNLYVEGGQTAIIDAVYLTVENLEDYEKSKKPDDHKRRAIILVTDGEDRNSYYREKQLLELLRESEVQIFVIGLIDDLSKDGGFISKSPQGKAKAFLERLAAESGGKAYFPTSTDQLPSLAKEISSELRTQYSIGYIPSNDKRDGTFRNIKVAVDDGPNKQKRIAVTRAGRMADAEGSRTNLPTPAQKPKTP